MDRKELLKLKAEVKYIPLQGNYLMVHQTDLEKYIDENYTPKAIQVEAKVILQGELSNLLEPLVIRRYNAELEKPEKFKTVIVSGGCAYWDGKNWHTRMDNDNGIIQWTVKYWCEMPSV